MNPVSITVAIIAQDEAEQLPELAAKLDWADEVLLLDGGSRDATVDVARQLRWRVAVRPFDNFAAQRNAAMELARGEWVFFIDADERPTSRLAAEVCRQAAAGRHTAWRVPIRSSIFGRPLRFSGTQGDRPIRLVARGSARWHGDVHEVLHTNGTVGQLCGWLEHRTLPDLHAFLTKMHHYTTLAARDRVARGIAPRWGAWWIAPLREVARRLVWKQGWLDGPEGWAFCLLSGLSEWVLERTHGQLWRQRYAPQPADERVIGPWRLSGGPSTRSRRAVAMPPTETLAGGQAP